jgi:hypothetical protein
MKKLMIVMVCVLMLLGSAKVVCAEGVTDRQLGEILLKEVWDAMKTKNMDLLGRKLAEGFQSVHLDGARNRQQELDLMSALNITDYSLSDIKVTRTGPVLVVTYMVSVEETIDGKKLLGEPTLRMSVFIERDNGWEWVSHANLREIKSDTDTPKPSVQTNVVDVGVGE